MIVSGEALKQAVKKAFEEGWNSTGQGCNAEHHNLSSEELAELRGDAIKPILEGLKAMQATQPAEPCTDDRYAVKLVDASGCLRLDCNGHRVHLSREQARDLMIKLAAGLDDGAECEARCTVFSADAIRVEPVQGARSERGVYVSLKVNESVTCVVLNPGDAEKIGRGLLALSLECKGS